MTGNGCPRCGAMRLDNDMPGAMMTFACGSYIPGKSEAKRIGVKYDPRLRVGPNCNPKAKREKEER